LCTGCGGSCHLDGIRVPLAGLAKTAPGCYADTRVPSRSFWDRPAETDAILIGSLVCFGNVSGLLKSLMDRSSPVLTTARGGSTLAGGAGITVFLVGGALGEFLGGNLSDRFGRKAVLFGAAVLAAPCFLLVLYGPSVLLFPFLAAAGLFVFSSNPVGTVAAQECLPGQTGLVSGLVMGLAWGVGGLALAPIGRFANLYGLVPVMAGVACLPLLAGILVLFFREGRPALGR